MTQTLNVEYQELMARADEIERPLPAIPSTNPPGPCDISFVKDAAVQLAQNADQMRTYLKACQREWQTLAKSLRNAAKAYEEADEGSAAAIDKTMNDGSGGTSASAGASEQVSALCDPDEDFSGYLPPPPPPPPAFQYPYYEVRQAAKDIEAGDQGRAFRAFATEWDTFQLNFQRETSDRFRPFVSWEGDARTTVETNFAQQRQWISSMVAKCRQLAKQANIVVDAHKRATLTTGYENQHAQEGAHPTTYEVSQCDYWYQRYTQYSQWYISLAIEWYEKLQAQSESVLAQYVSNGQIPLAQIVPDNPVPATRIDAPKTDDGTKDPSKPDNPFDPNNPSDPNNPFDPNIPLNEGGSPSAATPTVPSVPGMPTAPPGADTAKLDQAVKDLKKGAAGMKGGVKPASLGGGGAGMPSVPLQPAMETGAAAGPASAAPGAAAAAGRGLPGVGGAMGGGMGGGMAPMGGQGQQNAGKGKRVQSEDESMYTEERQWTEGVIGNRPRKAGPDK
ncbi:hypothetical protein AWC03_22070 [Mycobacterium europaeum]|uniref:PPE domain-containing protein n=1 Tax=Mycobacterium europaeum TaxID=761804 RepID=UPI000A14AF65|nr:hypothetical protein [Mycobacterium europaeum]ORV51506.1 hypothetical protein AWC03_22070 [Mycobacterium europaeum]